MHILTAVLGVESAFLAMARAHMQVRLLLERVAHSLWEWSWPSWNWPSGIHGIAIYVTLALFAYLWRGLESRFCRYLRDSRLLWVSLDRPRK